jgi:hypothetical protein
MYYQWETLGDDGKKIDIVHNCLILMKIVVVK